MEVSQHDPNTHLAIKGVKSLIFDIGGIILDDSDQILWQKLSLPEEKRRELEKILFFEDPRWSTEVMTGKLSYEKYMHEQMIAHPEYAKEIEFALGAGNFTQLLPLYQPNINLIEKLHKTGEYQMYWLSNMHDTEYNSLKQAGIFELLDGGVYSCIEHYRKPEREFYQILFNRYNLRPGECVFFDDRKRNLDAGEKFGMRGELVPELTALNSILEPYF